MRVSSHGPWSSRSARTSVRHDTALGESSSGGIMKICPFLVAGQASLPQRGPALLRPTPASTPRLEITRASDSEISASGEPVVSTQLWALEDDVDEAPRSSLECLGEPCRFFHAGGCRFDTLFESGFTGAALAGASTLLLHEGESDGPTTSSVLQEVWSLQRENLKEMIGGFRRLEGEQLRQQGALTGRIEQLLGRVEAVRSAEPEMGNALQERLGALQSSIAALDHALHSASASTAHAEIEKVRGEIAGTRSDIARARQEAEQSRNAIEGTLAAVAEVREDSRRALQESLEEM